MKRIQVGSIVLATSFLIGCAASISNSEMTGSDKIINAFTQSCQAESAEVKRGVEVEKNLSGFNGYGYVSRRSFKDKGDYIEWNIEVEEAGRFDVNFRYQAGADKKLTLVINGEPISANKPQFLKTENWSFTSLGAHTLHKGQNQIRIQVGPGGWVDIDEITLIGLVPINCGSAIRPLVFGKSILDHGGNPLTWRGVNVGFFRDFSKDHKDALDLKNAGANFVRVVLPWYNDSTDTRNANSPKTCHMQTSALENLDRRINAYASQGIWTQLAPRSSFGAGDGTYDSGKGGEGHFWDNAKLREEYIEMYECLVLRYKDVDFIAAWEGLSEPRIDARRKSEVREFYEEVFDRLEAVDPSNTPFVTGPARFFNAGELTDEYYISDRTDVIYTVDHFKPHNYTHQKHRNKSAKVPLTDAVVEEALSELDEALQFREKYNVPLHINQFGAMLSAPNHVEFDKLQIDLFEEKALGWSYWQWRNGKFAALDDGDVRKLLEDSFKK